MKVYIVLEEDRGCGTSVVGVYSNKEVALKVESESSRYELFEEELTFDDGEEELYQEAKERVFYEMEVVSRLTSLLSKV